MRCTGGGLYVVGLLSFAANLVAGGPCTCADVKKLEKRLEQREHLLDAAEQVAAEAADMTFPTSKWFKERFIKVAFGEQTPTVEAVQDYGKKPEVSPQLKDQYCDDVAKAVEAHENDHVKFDKTESDAKYLLRMARGREGEFLARKEASGYAVEVDMLRAALDKVNGQCSEWKGTVTVESHGRASGFYQGDRNRPFTSEGNLSLNCTVQDITATCTLSANTAFSGKGGGYTEQASGVVETYVSVGYEKGKNTLQIGQIRVEGTITGQIDSTRVTSKSQMQFGGWQASSTGPEDPVKCSGSWTDGAGTVINWNLTK